MLIVLFAIKSFLLWREFVGDGFTHAKSYHDIQRQKHSKLSVKNIERKKYQLKKGRIVFWQILFDSLTPRIMLLLRFFEQEALGNVVVA